MAGPSSQGWSKMAAKYNFGTTPPDLKRQVLAKQVEIDQEAAQIAFERSRLCDLVNEVENKSLWIKSAEKQIKIAENWLKRNCSWLEVQEDTTEELEKKYNRSNRWVIEEKNKYPFDFPE